MRRRFPIQILAAFTAAIALSCLRPMGAELHAEQLTTNPPFYIIANSNAGETVTIGQGVVIARGGVAIVPLSILEDVHGAIAVLPEGKRIAVGKIEAVDESGGLVRIRLGRVVPKPSGKLTVTPMPSKNQRILVVTVDEYGMAVGSRCTVQAVRQLPYLPGYFHLETSLALPPPGGAIYSAEGTVLAMVVRRFDEHTTGVVVSSDILVRTAGLKSRKKELSKWSSARTTNWSQGPVARYVEAQAAAWAGRHGRTMEILEPVVGSAGALEGAVAALLGESYLAMGLLPESIVALRSAIENGTVACKIYQQLAWAYLETGQYSEAKKFSDMVIEGQSERAVGYLLLARLSNLQGDYDKAVYDARRALKRFPQCQCAHYERGVAYLGQGRYESAIESLRQAVTLDPADPDSLHALGYAYLRSNRPVEAVELLKAAADLKPEKAENWRALGEACSRTDRDSEALEAYRQAICAAPKDQSTYYWLASECLRQGFHDDAIQILRQGLESCGPSAWLTYYLGKAYCCAGQLDEARRQAKQLSRQNPSLARLLDWHIETSEGS